MNKQLISYYFGGKEGLYAELARQWQQTTAELADPDQPLDAVVSGFAMTSLHDRDWTRLMVWANLSDTGADPESPGCVERYADQLGRLVRHLTEDQ